MSDSEHEREAEWRWGNTDAYKESNARVAKYGPAEWARIRDEGQALLDLAVDLMRRGLSPESDEAMAYAELSREYNSRWFYETSHEMHAMLAEGYVADERFKSFYESVAVGLAQFVSSAFIANAKRAGANLSIDDALATVRANMGLALAPPSAPPIEGKAERRAREVAARIRKR